MACSECFNGCGQIIADKCVKYTGDDVDSLGICNSDSIYEIENILIAQLQTALDGTGIVLNTTLGCTLLTTLLNGADKTLSTLFQVYSSAICTLSAQVNTINTTLGANSSVSFDTGCLTGLPASPTRDVILQALLTKVCSIDARVTAIEIDYVKASNLNTLIANYLTGAGASTSTQQYNKMVPYVAYEYYGSLSNFDSGGKGLLSAGFDKVFLCNGANGTPDRRGRVGVGANVNIPGGSLDTAVNPSLAQNSGYGISLNTKLGEYSHVNVASEMVAHTHTTIGQVVIVQLPGQTGGDNNDNANKTAFSGADKGPTETTFNFNLPVTFTIPNGVTSSVGASQPHNNVQPSIGANYIMYIA